MGNKGKSGRKFVKNQESVDPNLKFVHYIPKQAKIHGINLEENDRLATVSLKYYQSNWECFSDWPPNKLRDFTGFVNIIQQSTWSKIQVNSGLNCTKITNDRLPQAGAVSGLSEEVGFYKMRVSKESRVVGFRCNAVFYLTWLDHDHRIDPEK